MNAQLLLSWWNLIYVVPFLLALACAAVAIESGVQIIRAHDVAETVQAARMMEAILKNRE